MKVFFKKAAGLDIHKKIIVCSIRVVLEDGSEQIATKEFETFRQGLFKLRDWLSAEKVEIVAMESTSVYWRSAYEILEEAEIPLMLVNARHVKNVPGRKTDVQDSVWIASLASCGLLRPSFIPPKDFRELRLMTRYRRKLCNMRASEKNRLQKVLDDCGIRLSCVVSDIDGVSASLMIKSLIENRILPEEIAKLGKTSLKKKEKEIAQSLEANISDRHRYLLKEIQEHIEDLSEQVTKIDEQVVTAMQLYREAWQLLQTIPGIDKIGAAMLLSEIGVDMDSFGSSDRLCSWAGVCPGNNESAGKRKSGKTRKGNTYVKTLLCEFANSARMTRSQFKSRYESLVVRRGHKRTIIALGHKILETAFILLKRKVHYQDSGVDYNQLVVKRNAPRWIKTLKQYGYITGKDVTKTTQ